MTHLTQYSLALSILLTATSGFSAEPLSRLSSKSPNSKPPLQELRIQENPASFQNQKLQDLKRAAQFLDLQNPDFDDEKSLKSKLMTGGAGPGGGNAVGIRFYILTKQALMSMDIEQLQGKATRDELLATLEAASIGITQKELAIDEQNPTLISDAVHFRNLQVIIANQERLQSLLAVDDNLVRDLGVHEVLGLRGIETSGKYRYGIDSRPRYQYPNFELIHLPIGSTMVIYQPIDFLPEQTKRTGYGKTYSTTSAFRYPWEPSRQRIIKPRSCQVSGIDDRTRFIINFTGDAVCERIKLEVLGNSTFEGLNDSLTKIGAFIVPPLPIIE